jgi:hypothetical protein
MSELYISRMYDNSIPPSCGGSVVPQARLSVLESLYAELQEKQLKMEEEYRQVERERDELYATFESSIRTVQEQSDFRCVVLTVPALCAV